MDSRKRTRCKICKERVNLVYQKEGNRIRFGCPKCGGHGEMPFRKTVTRR